LFDAFSRGESMGDPDGTWPAPPNPASAAFRVAKLTVPFRGDLPPVGEATGLLVKVQAVGTAHATFVLRHAFIGSDVGLPGAGIPLEGGLHVQDGRARVAVYTSTFRALFVGLVMLFIVLFGASLVVYEGGMGSIAWLAMVVALVYWSYRRAKRGVELVVADAVATLERLRASGQTDPWG
jgi:hypothetical protein